MRLIMNARYNTRLGAGSTHRKDGNGDSKPERKGGDKSDKSDRGGKDRNKSDKGGKRGNDGRRAATITRTARRQRNGSVSRVGGPTT